MEKEIFQLQRPNDFSDCSIANIASFLPLISQHIIDSLTQGVIQLINAVFCVLKAHLSINFELIDLLFILFLIVELSDSTEHHFNPLINDTLLSSTHITLFSQLRHLALQLDHIYIHLILRGLKAHHVLSVSLNGVVNAHNCRILELLDLIHT